MKIFPEQPIIHRDTAPGIVCSFLLPKFSHAPDIYHFIQYDFDRQGLCLFLIHDPNTCAYDMSIIHWDPDSKHRYNPIRILHSFVALKLSNLQVYEHTYYYHFPHHYVFTNRMALEVNSVFQAESFWKSDPLRVLDIACCIGGDQIMASM